MSASQEFRLPDVGEGLTEAEVVTWHVSAGDEVAVNDVIVEIETAKSLVELPSPYAGSVEQLLVAVGETVPVGTPLIRIGDGGAGALQAPPAGLVLDAAPSDAPVQEKLSANAGDTDDEKPAVLVGPGPKAAAGRRRHLGAAAGRAGALPAAESPRARATPPVRSLAKQLGVDVEGLAATLGGVVTRLDVEAAARSSQSTPGSQVLASRSPAEPGDYAETRIPVKGVRKVTAAAMVRSAFTAPHVTEWLTVDMTESMDLVRRLKQDRAWQGVRINPLVLVARAFLLAIRQYPEVNASWDDDREEIVVKHYINLGIAAATPRGLLVPNIRHADRLDVRSLADALESLVATARAGKTQPVDMVGGTVTITNIGALGVDAGTPILNPGESAILAFGAVRSQPWVVDGEIQIRELAQLAMSFDHRLVDGELGSHVLALTGEILSDPGRALLFA